MKGEALRNRNQGQAVLAPVHPQVCCRPGHLLEYVERAIRTTGDLPSFLVESVFLPYRKGVKRIRSRNPLARPQGLTLCSPCYGSNSIRHLMDSLPPR
jgi:hypothetical protein